MAVRGLDHLAITVADVEQTLVFYKRVLGATTHFEDAWRDGKIPVVLLQVGESRISVHDAASPATPHAAAPTPGSADVCFRWSGSLRDGVKHLEACGVPVIEGPVPRPAADGSLGQSIYFRDPDGNLLEWLSTDPD